MSLLYSVDANGVVVFYRLAGDEDHKVIATLKARAASITTSTRPTRAQQGSDQPPARRRRQNPQA